MSVALDLDEKRTATKTRSEVKTEWDKLDLDEKRTATLGTRAFFRTLGGVRPR